MADNDNRNDAELQEGDELVRTTIVGGQPRKRPTIRMSIRVGLERVLYRASLDRAFRKALLKDRERAMQEAGMELSAGEAAVLASVERAALSTMIDNVRPEVRKDRRFVKAVAATFVTLATGTTEIGCGHETASAGGAQPDVDYLQDVPAQVEQDVQEPFPDPGISSDFNVVEDVDLKFDTGGMDPGDPGMVTEDVGPAVVGGIMPDDVQEGVEVEVTSPTDWGHSGDVVKDSDKSGK